MSSSPTASSPTLSFLKENQFRKALGIDNEGMCLKHPNVPIYSSGSVIDYCKVCRSEHEAYDLQQQKQQSHSFAFLIHQIQDLQNSEETSTDSATTGTTSIATKEDEPLKSPPSPSFAKSSSSTRQTVLRAVQVQQWELLENEKEVQRLKKEIEQLTLDKKLLSSQLEIRDQLVLRQTDQIASLQELVERQKTTINQDLKKIKSIAMNRASLSPRARNQISNISSLSGTETLIGSEVHQESPPRLPNRKTSEATSIADDDEEEQYKDYERPLHDAIATNLKIQDPPRRPVRKTSNSKSGGTGGMGRKESISQNQNLKPPPLPSRMFSKGMLKDPPKSSASPQRSFVPSAASREIPFDPSESQEDRKSSLPVSLPPSREISFTPSEPDDNQQQTPHPQKESQEIAFIPPPPAPDTNYTPNTHSSASSSNGQTREKSASAQPGRKKSKDIQFDAGAVANPSRTSIAEMKFDSNSLLDDARVAMSSPPVNISLSNHRKSLKKSPRSDDQLKNTQEIDVAMPMHEEDDHDDTLKNVPNVLLVKQRSADNETLVSGLTFYPTQSYLSQEEGLPKTSLRQGSLTKKLPIEMDFDSDDESDSLIVPPKKMGDQRDQGPPRAQSYLSEDEEIPQRKSLRQGSLMKKLPIEMDFDSDEETESQPIPTNLKEPPISPNSTPKANEERNVSTSSYQEVNGEEVKDKYDDGGTYFGTISRNDRLPNGFGKMLYSNQRRYEGEWRDGRWHGHGKLENPDGDCYEGTFVYDEMHGSGTYTWKNGNVYRGAFNEGKRHGTGKFEFANGNVYEGDFVNGRFEGKGSFEFDGGFYEGQWRRGVYHGKGFLLYADGSHYNGPFVNGVAHGQGEVTSANGAVHKGYWANGQLQPSGG